MTNFKYFQSQALSDTDRSFDEKALQLFYFQVDNNEIYRSYIEHLGADFTSYKTIYEIPFLPISFFKEFVIRTGNWQEETIFESSGTTSDKPSKHYLPGIDFYHNHAKKLFTDVFGDPADCITLALLPSYIERSNSSLVSMVSSFIDLGKEGSGFFMNNFADLKKVVNENKGEQIILWGVTFALLELGEFGIDLQGVTVIETGGMKGRGMELVREDLYQKLKYMLNTDAVYSEYGMTELLSQSYAINGKFENNNSMKVMIRDINDPFNYVKSGKTGGVNVIDLANAHSCSFIETKDLGRYVSSTYYEIVGRFDNSDIRGCNLLFD